MNRITALIAEDELAQRRAFVEMLAEEWPDLVIVAECEDGLATLESLQLHAPSVAFLDIRMPGLSGLAAAAQSGVHSHIVFTTAYSEHAVHAFDHGAIDYLLKPISRERLRIAIERLKRLLTHRGGSDIKTTLAKLHELAIPRSTSTLRWVSATSGTTVRMIPLEEIVFFQSSDKYTRVVSRRGEAIIRTSLKELISQLDANEFWQVHRSVIVRVACVRAMRAIGGERYELQLDGSNERVPVSVAFKNRFRGM